jgi:hypothetical protein
MHAMRNLREAVLCVAAVVMAGCGDSGTGPAAPEPNFVRLESDPGDFIGQGRNYDYTSANAVISVTAIGGHLSLRVDGDESWTGEFRMPSGAARIQPGTYANLDRYPFHDPAEGGLSWSGEGRGCNTLVGSFTVDSVRYSGDTLTAIDLRFAQRCDGTAYVLDGTVHWRRGDTTRPPGPAAIPASLWRPPAGSTPVNGNFVYLASDAGDFIGQGQTYTYTPANAAIAVSSSGGRLTFSVDAAQDWIADFQTMNAITRLQVGYYPDLSRFPFHNPAKGGFDFSGGGRGCNTLSGWVAIDRATYSGNTLTGLEMRFEQHCDGVTPALRGAIRWNA